ncbi:MAG: ABC transporter substrate-binding protein, partial [Clostridium sp.]|nr:ABC transporter substrate-binding protein [Clostridium sp.]
MKRYGKLTALILSSVMVFSALSLTGCGKKDDSAATNGTNKTDTSKSGKDSIKIGVLTSKSGVLETWGTDEIRGIELGIEYATNGTNEVNGQPIQLIVEDDTSTAGVAVQKAVKLLEQDKVHMITGGISSGNALAVMEKAAAAKVPYIIESAATDAITGKNFNPYTFRVGRSFRQVTMAGGAYLNKVGKTFYV